MEVRSAQKNTNLLYCQTSGCNVWVDDEGCWLGWMQDAVLMEGFSLRGLFLCFCSCSDLYG